MIRRASTAFLPLLALAACTGVDDPFLNTSAAKADAPALATSVPVGQAMAALPGLIPTDIRQATAGKRISQTILYVNRTRQAGENTLSVTIAAGASDPAVTRVPTRSELEAELSEAIPGIAMRVETTIGDNAYGAFGMATGSLGARGACLYAWQVVRRLPADAASSGLGRAPSAGIRLRYCDPAASAESLTALMRGLQIRAAGGTALAAPPPAIVQSLKARVIAPVVVNDAPARRPARLVRRPSAVSPAAPPAVDAPAVAAGAAEIPLPGETARPASAPAAAPAPAASAPAVVEATPAASVKVPLPGG